MCVGPTPGSVAAPTIQQKPAGIADAGQDVWTKLAEQGGTIGAIAQAKLKAMNPSGPAKNDLKYPVIPGA